jgi:hypothetical protein
MVVLRKVRLSLDQGLPYLIDITDYGRDIISRSFIRISYPFTITK